jgi:hypothetical protein
MKHLGKRFAVLMLDLAPVLPAVAQPGLTVRDGVLLRDGKPFRAVGVNYFNVFMRTLKTEDDTSYEAGFATLKANNIAFARFAACGFWPKEFELYGRDKEAYFKRLDGVVRAAEKQNAGLIPSLFCADFANLR